MSVVEIRKVTTKADLSDAFAVRRAVFIEEQAVPEELELDEFDHDASTIHFVARNAGGQPVGTARIRPYGTSDAVKVERVAVLRDWRGTGLGRRLMAALESEARSTGYRLAKLNAQTHARAFYEGLGYEPRGDLFMEANIEHIAMEKRL